MSLSLEERYQHCLQTLYQKLPMFTRLGAAAYKPDLGNIQALCDILGNPEKQFKSIHIAGTNGKGSVSHMLASVFQTAGYKTGLYTSPHISDFRERIKLNGQFIPKEKVLQFWEEYEREFEAIEPSFFEITVAMAFDYFAKENIDIAIVEVGLGGLYDSTNILLPELSIITNISFDHTDLLGKTLEEIALQKAGIIKPQVPVVIGETQSSLEKLFITQSIVKQAPLLFADAQFEIVQKEWRNGHWHVHMVNMDKKEIFWLDFPLSGKYQLKNIKTVLAALDVMKQKGWQLKPEVIYRGLNDVQRLTGIQGRFDVVQHNPMVVLDVSHNEAGIRELMEQVHTLSVESKHIILGMVKDKDLTSILSLFPKEAKYYFTQAQIPRALPATELQQLGQTFSLVGEAFNNVKEACKAAQAVALNNDLILVCGSFFILQEAYAVFQKK